MTSTRTSQISRDRPEGPQIASSDFVWSQNGGRPAPADFFASFPGANSSSSNTAPARDARTGEAGESNSRRWPAAGARPTDAGRLTGRSAGRVLGRSAAIAASFACSRSKSPAARSNAVARCNLAAVCSKAAASHSISVKSLDVIACPPFARQRNGPRAQCTRTAAADQSFRPDVNGGHVTQPHCADQVSFRVVDTDQLVHCSRQDDQVPAGGGMLQDVGDQLVTLARGGGHGHDSVSCGGDADQAIALAPFAFFWHCGTSLDGLPTAFQPNLAAKSLPCPFCHGAPRLSRSGPSLF